MPQVVGSPKVYDVCIIGSGAGGGTAAKVLTEGGLNVVMLEAGPLLNPRKDYKEHVWPYALPHRGADVGGRALHELNDEFLAPNGFWEIEGEPYTYRSWLDLSLVSLAHRRWPHQSLRAHLAAHVGRRHEGPLQGWPGR